MVSRVFARALDERNVEVEFKIADGYYMYRDRFSFATESGRRLAGVEMPRGTPKDVTSQGCADIGVCYTPLEQLVQVRLPRTRSP